MSTQMGSHRAVQEREARGYSWLWPGLVGVAGVAAGVTSSLFVPQQEVYQPKWRPAGPAIHALPVAGNPQGSIAIRQEQPPHPQGSFFFSTTSAVAVVQTAVSQPIVQRQEQPGHPAPTIRAGIQGPNVRPPVLDTILGRQESPFHPGSLLSSTPGVTTSTFKAPNRDFTIGVQEFPWHPRSSLATGPQGPNVRPPIADNILTKQELPFHPLPFLTSTPGVTNPTSRPPVTDTVLVRQQSPDHPSSTFRSGIQGPNVRVSITDYIIKFQEQPFHPVPFLTSFPPTPPVISAPAVTRLIITRQETPGHPLPSLSYFTRQANVGVPVTSRIVTVQERPYHPGPFLFAHVTAKPVGQGQGLILTRQEQPFQALWPSPPMGSGTATDQEQAFGYILGGA